MPRSLDRGIFLHKKTSCHARYFPKITVLAKCELAAM